MDAVNPHFPMGAVMPHFPWKIEKAHWYILFLELENILTEQEADLAFERLSHIPGAINYKEGERDA